MPRHGHRPHGHVMLRGERGAIIWREICRCGAVRLAEEDRSGRIVRVVEWHKPAPVGAAP